MKRIRFEVLPDSEGGWSVTRSGNVTVAVPYTRIRVLLQTRAADGGNLSTFQ